MTVQEAFKAIRSSDDLPKQVHAINIEMGQSSDALALMLAIATRADVDLKGSIEEAISIAFLAGMAYSKGLKQ